MCGIYAHLHHVVAKKQEYPKNPQLTRRGPDEFREYHASNFYVAFHRLAIVGRDGMQPFVDRDADITLLVNGEIYNHEEYNQDCKTQSDCEVILHLYKKLGFKEMIKRIDGEFAIILIDNKHGITYACRDRYGVKPLYYSMQVYDDATTVELASLVSPMNPNSHVNHIIPGTLYEFSTRGMKVSHLNYFICKKTIGIYNSLVAAVTKRITHSDRPVGFLLSGGLDSSIVLALALRSGKLKQPPMVFTFGFTLDAPDVKAAKVVVDHLRSQYGPECVNYRLVTPEQLGYVAETKDVATQERTNIQAGLDAIPEVIEMLETFDTTTVRASTPMYLLCKWISQNTDVKVILSGEGSDELFGGYLYFKYAPNHREFVNETHKLMNELYMYDNLRADRSSASNGLEIRPPFLDTNLVYSVQMSDLLQRSTTTTKELLRNVIREALPSLLPVSILDGKKEAFSDAVGYDWKRAIPQHAERQILRSPYRISQLDLSPFIIPGNPESMYFQILFKQYNGSQRWNLLKRLWLPNKKWIDTGDEPSATALPNYV